MLFVNVKIDVLWNNFSSMAVYKVSINENMYIKSILLFLNHSIPRTAPRSDYAESFLFSVVV